jgi:hypothetical protein
LSGIGSSGGATSDVPYNTISSSIHSIPCASRVGIGEYRPFLILSPFFFGLGIAECRPVLFRIHRELLGGRWFRSRLWPLIVPDLSGERMSLQRMSILPSACENVAALSLYF